MNGATFQESLKDGIILCKLVNKCVPGSAIRPTESKMPFKQMENISAFLTILETIGVPKHDSFQTIDLYEDKNIGQAFPFINLGSFVHICAFSSMHKEGIRYSIIGREAC